MPVVPFATTAQGHAVVLSFALRLGMRQVKNGPKEPTATREQTEPTELTEPREPQKEQREVPEDDVQVVEKPALEARSVCFGADGVNGEGRSIGPPSKLSRGAKALGVSSNVGGCCDPGFSSGSFSSFFVW